MSAPRKRRKPPRQRRIEALELLEHGRELIAKPEQFTTKVWARDRWSHPVHFVSPKAVRFCAAGALFRAEIDIHGDQPLRVSESLEVGRPARLELAFHELARGTTIAVHAKLRLLWIEETTKLGQLTEQSKRKVDEVSEGWRWSYVQLVIAFNEEPAIGHGDLLKGYDVAILDLASELFGEEEAWKRWMDLLWPPASADSRADEVKR